MGSASLVCRSRFASATCDTMSSSREIVTSRQADNIVENQRRFVLRSAKHPGDSGEKSQDTNGEKDWQFWRIHLFSKSHRIAR